MNAENPHAKDIEMMRLKVDYFSEEYNDAIAIIGLSGAFPGADTPQEHWDNIINEKECIHFFTNEELLREGVDEETLNNPKYVKAAPILNNIYRFDSEFFGYSPREALAIDPQQRFFLEHAWHTFEDAGYNPHNLSGSVGVFAGSGGILNSYLLEYFKAYPEIQGMNSTYHHFGNDKDFLTARLSYLLNLKGPSIAIQTACSSSTVAIHTACQSILNGECDKALAGAVNIRIPHHRGYFYHEGGLYSKDGHCRIFDEEPGILYGSAIGIVLLKPLQKAIKDHDHIYGIIRSTAINNDGGEKISFAATSMKGQRNCFIDAVEVSGIDIETINYLEVFGTGNKMGDQTEFIAFTQAFRHFTSKNNFCAIGSIKPNVGHLEVASGVSSLITILYAMKHQIIPATINVNKLTTDVDFTSSPFYLNTKQQIWKQNDTPRRAALNSIAIGGTNAVLIIEEYISQEEIKSPQNNQEFILALSAKTKSALLQLIEKYRDFINANPDVNIADLCYTANAGRNHFFYRTYCIANSVEEFNSLLSSNEIRERIIKIPKIKDSIEDLLSNNEQNNEFLSKLGALYLEGTTIEWFKLTQSKERHRLSLPLYPFEGEEFFIEKNVPIPFNKTNTTLETPDLLSDKFAERETQEWVIRNLKSLLGFKTFSEEDLNKSFTSLGLDSLNALDFVEKLSSKMPKGVKITPSDIAKFDSVNN